MYGKFENDRKKLTLSIFWHISNFILLYLEKDAINQKMLLNKKFLEFDFALYANFQNDWMKFLKSVSDGKQVSYRGASLLKNLSYNNFHIMNSLFFSKAL